MTSDIFKYYDLRLYLTYLDEYLPFCVSQLAILASYSGDDLVAVYRYFRSLAVDSPFSTARENLIIAFEKVSNSACIS